MRWWRIISVISWEAAQKKQPIWKLEEESKYRIRALKGTAGGLIGTAKGKISLIDSAAALYVEGMYAGGLVGTAEKAAAAAAASGSTVQIQSCYVGGHTANKKFDTSQNQGMGQTPIQL